MDEIVRQGIEEITSNFDLEVVEGKNILVTGGAGFLGSWICDVLVENKANVISVDNLSSGQKGNISHLLGKKNFKFMELDITQPILFDEKIDLVMHLASRASPFEFERAKEEVVNIGSEKEVTILELAKLVNELTNSSSEVEFHPLPKDDPPRRKTDISKAKNLLDWKPKVSLEEGLRRMIEWFKRKLEL